MYWLVLHLVAMVELMVLEGGAVRWHPSASCLANTTRIDTTTTWMQHCATLQHCNTKQVQQIFKHPKQK